MDFVMICIEIVAILILAPTIVLLMLDFLSVQPSEWDYFQVLSYTEWKTGREIRREMQILKKGWLSGPKVYQDLSKLLKKGLIEVEIEEKRIDATTVKVRSYRKKSGGWKKKTKIETKLPKFDPDLAPV